MKLAPKAMLKRSSGAPIKVTGSIGRTPNNKQAMNLVLKSPSVVKASFFSDHIFISDLLFGVK
jgi:hypothetical protein